MPWQYHLCLRLIANTCGVEEREMKRIIASVLLAVALLTSGAMVTQSGITGTAYAEGGGGGS
jgi:hypothetical protein